MTKKHSQFESIKNLKKIWKYNKFVNFCFTISQKIVKIAIYTQHPFKGGGSLAIFRIDIAFEYLVNGRSPIKSEHVFKNEIRLLENL